ncbi:MAG: NUMOD4 motif-containing HNH endonuclease [Allosphingosinicella sp.]
MTGAEEWRPVVGWEGLYEVSNQGRVRSLDRAYDRPASRRRPQPWRRVYRGRMIKPAPTSAGYLVVNLHRSNSRLMRLVHCLALEAFVGPPPPGMIGLHWDDDPNNNRLANLRWGTRRDNWQDAVRNRAAAS